MAAGRWGDLTGVEIGLGAGNGVGDSPKHEVSGRALRASTPARFQVYQAVLPPNRGRGGADAA